MSIALLPSCNSMRRFTAVFQIALISIFLVHVVQPIHAGLCPRHLSLAGLGPHHDQSFVTWEEWRLWKSKDWVKVLGETLILETFDGDLVPQEVIREKKLARPYRLIVEEIRARSFEPSALQRNHDFWTEPDRAMARDRFFAKWKVSDSREKELVSEILSRSSSVQVMGIIIEFRTRKNIVRYAPAGKVHGLPFSRIRELVSNSIDGVDLERVTRIRLFHNHPSVLSPILPPALSSSDLREILVEVSNDLRKRAYDGELQLSVVSNIGEEDFIFTNSVLAGQDPWTFGSTE